MSFSTRVIVALAAIKELYRQNQELKAANEELRQRIAVVEGRVR